MYWKLEKPFTRIQQFFVNILKSGPIPKHIAFIMDGNRRYAKKENIKKIEGHSKGVDKFIETVHWCKIFGIKELTVYGFSIDNFKRSKAEVDDLMNLTKSKIEEFLENKEDIMENKICIRIIGNLSYLSPELRKLIGQVMMITENNNNFFLNIVFSYTSRDEITNSIKCVMDGVSKGLININDIDEQLLSNCMYTNKSPEPDLLVRTSGEKRFSDFLLWQISCTQVCFTDVLWPELSLWHMFIILLKYQTNYNYMLSVKKTKKHLENYGMKNKNRNRIENFIDDLNETRRHEIENYLSLCDDKK